MQENSPITLSQAAIRQALQLQQDNAAWQGLPLRLYLEGKGCDGFYYGVSFDAQKPEDLCFTQVDGDLRVDLIVDPQTLEFTEGSQVIWVDDERGKGFLVENPQHKKFRGKFFKRSAWLQKLGAAD